MQKHPYGGTITLRESEDVRPEASRGPHPLFHTADLSAEHVRDALWQGADDEADVLPYARDHDLVVVTSDVTDFAGLPTEVHAGIVLLYDDTLPAYSVTSGLIAMVDADPSRDAFAGREELDSWV